jgi:hypothetical protein
MIVVGDREADPHRRPFPARIDRGRMDPVEQNLPLDPVARVDDVKPVGQLLRDEFAAGRAVGHGLKPPSLRGAKRRSNPAWRNPPWIASLRSQ